MTISPGPPDSIIIQTGEAGKICCLCMCTMHAWVYQSHCEVHSIIIDSSNCNLGQLCKFIVYIYVCVYMYVSIIALDCQGITLDQH